MIGMDERFRAVDDVRDCEEIFEDYTEDLRIREKEERKKKLASQEKVFLEWMEGIGSGEIELELEYALLISDSVHPELKLSCARATACEWCLRLGSARVSRQIWLQS